MGIEIDRLGPAAQTQVKAELERRHFTRKAQRDYIYRRRLFIDLWARPKGWVSTEYIKPKK